MMADVANLAVKLTASSAGLDAELKRAMGKLEAFQKNVLSGFKVPGMALGALTNPLTAALSSIPIFGAALGGALSAESLNASINGIVQMDKEATKLGFTIKELSTLMTLEGPDFSTEAMLTGVRKLQTALSEALIDPAGAEAKTLGLFGLDPEKMMASGSMGALRQFADRMAALSESERLTLSKLMGKAGHELIPFLSGGAAAFDGMSEAERKGQAITEDMVRSARDAANAVDDLGDSWTALKNKMAVALAPGVTGFTKGLDRLISGDVGAGEAAGAVGSVLFGRSTKSLEAFVKEKFFGQDSNFIGAGGGFGNEENPQLTIARKAREEREAAFIAEMTGDANRAANEIAEDQHRRRQSFIDRVAGKAMGEIGQPLSLSSGAEHGSATAIENMARWAAGTIGGKDLDFKEMLRQELEQVRILDRIRAAVEGEAATMVIPGGGV